MKEFKYRVIFGNGKLEGWFFGDEIKAIELVWGEAEIKQSAYVVR